MKKVVNVVLIILMMVPFLTVPLTRVEAKTLRQLKEELEKTKQNMKQEQEKEKLTQAQIDQINANVNNINATIKQISEDVVRLNKEIEDAKVEIVEKEKQIKEVINFLQVSSGESEYMEYIFGAKDFTDFIYRMSITEQMTDYNNRLIDEANKLIESNKKKQVELANKDKELRQKQIELGDELKKLKSDLSKIYDVYVDLEAAIKMQENMIKMYEVEYKCNLDEDITVCARGALPGDTAMWRPLQSGFVSSEFGNRGFWLNGSWVTDYHSGIDVGVPLGSNVYSTAAGTVAALLERQGCGGNMVWIHHKINGKTYTSVYMHLYQFRVKVGDQVTKDTVIATSGGDPSVTWWDGCSTGSHLHFSLSSGLAGLRDAVYLWSDFYAGLFNPRNMVNFPYGSFSNRTSKY